MKIPLLPAPSWLSRLGLAITSVLAIIAGFALASVLFVVLMTGGLLFALWLWWQFRRLARQAHAAQPACIEGEYTVIPARLALEEQNLHNQEPFSAAPRRHATRKRRRVLRLGH